MTKKQKRMKDAVEYLQKYMNTYSDQPGYMDYTDTLFIDYVLYGLGVALDGKRHKFANGYDKFKEKLADHLASQRQTQRRAKADGQEDQ